jgi:uncharacterized protein (TIGR02284 family)
VTSGGELSRSAAVFHHHRFNPRVSRAIPRSRQSAGAALTRRWCRWQDSLITELDMVTTIGTEDKLEDLLKDLIQLDHDAIAAYDAAVERIDSASYKTTLSGFCDDHRRHTVELGEHLTRLGKTPPGEGDMKSMLTKGKVVLGALMGDKAILQAMKTNEDDTNTAYERAVGHKDASGDLHATLQRALEDERRHRAWMVETIEML